MPGGGGLRLKYSNPMHLDDVAADFPDMTIIIAHPSWPWQDEALSVCLHKPNVYIDLSGWSPKYFPPQLVQYANTQLKNKMLFGSDYPVLTPDRWIKDFEDAGFKPEVRDADPEGKRDQGPQAQSRSLNVDGRELDWNPSPFAVSVERRADGVMVLGPVAELAPYPPRVTDPLEQWAARTPEATLVARRGADGAWQRISYRLALERVRALAAGLARLELNAERPLLILSGNSIEHLLLGLAAMYLGVPYCPVSVAYSQSTSDLVPAPLRGRAADPWAHRRVR